MIKHQIYTFFGDNFISMTKAYRPGWWFHMKMTLTSIGNPIVEIRWSYDRLSSTMGFPILERWHLYIESGSWWLLPGLISVYPIMLSSHWKSFEDRHYNDVTMGMIASQITSLTIVYSIVYSDADQRKHQSSASLAFVRGIHRGPVNSPHKWAVTRKMLPFDDVIMGIVWVLDIKMSSRDQWYSQQFNPSMDNW